MDHMKKLEPDFEEDLGGLWVTKKGGRWLAGTYFFRTPLPISIRTKNKELQKLIDSHDRIIKLFWLSAITLLPVEIIILKLFD